MLVSRSTKLKIGLLADLIILAVIFPTYLYVDSQIIEPANFQVTDMMIDSDWAQVGEPVEISATVTNIGDKSGNYTVTLSVDDIPITAKTVQLSGGENTTVVFTATELTEGNHTITIETLSQSLKVTSEKPNTPAKLELTNLVTSRKVAEIGDPITVSVVGTNIGDEPGEFFVELFINNQKRETKSIYLDGGKTTSVRFEVIENTEGTYFVTLGTLTTSFEITSEAQPVKPAEFQVTDLTVNPTSASVDEVIEISVRVNNIGEATGSYSVNLQIDGTTRETRDITLAGQATEFVEFKISETNSGTHTVEIDSQSGSFTVSSITTSSNIRLHSMIVNPYEVWKGETVNIRAKADNMANELGTLQVRLLIDKEVKETKSFSLDAGATDVSIDFSVAAGNGPIDLGTEGYRVELVNAGNQSNSLIGYFQVASDGYHTLSINRAGGGTTPMIFTLNGETLETPYRAFKPTGQYTIATDQIVDLGTGVVEFSHWNDGSTDASRTINFDKYTSLMAQFNIISGYASCPSLYTWNGTNYFYITEVSNAGWLGYIDYINENGEIVFGGGNPWDHVKIDKNQLQPKTDEVNGYDYYDCVLFQQWNEIFYIDTAYLVVVDHPNETDVYSTMVNYVNRGFYGQIYTIKEEELLTPVSAINERGEDVLSKISQLDGIFTYGSNGVCSPAWNNITLNQLTLDLGDLSDTPEIKLVINGMVDWGPAEPYYDWIDQFKTAATQGLVKNDTQINPPAYMEVMDAQGNWVKVPQDRQMPIPGDYVPRTFTVDLNGLFSPELKEYKIRITNFWNVTFDYIGIDITPQENITVNEILPIATLEPLEFAVSISNVSGRFTKYGDITELLLEADDKFVIGMQGDKVSLKFPTTDLPQLEEEMERSFFLFVASWFKDEYGNWGYGFDFTVEPLPFQDMTGFPYPSTESHPDDSYLDEWNTRIINVP
jgi:hypothetical protein